MRVYPLKLIVLFVILSEAILLAPLLGESPISPELSFYGISHKADGETVDDTTISALRAKGFIRDKADLTIHKLQSVETVPLMHRPRNSDGTFGKLETQEALTIHLEPSDTKEFSKLTSGNMYYRILVLLNGKFLMAPIVEQPILDGQLQISFPKNSDVESIKKQFDQFVSK